MKIAKIETTILRFEVKNAASDSLHKYDAGCTLLTKVMTDDGITGYNNTYFGRVKAGPNILKELIDKELASVVIGEDPFFARRIRDKLWFASEYVGITGIAQLAISAIDICIWDIVGKALNKPVAQVLGACRDRIPAYAMVGWYYDSEGEFLNRCIAAADEGFKAIKLKVGKGELSDDTDRIKAVQKELGYSFRIMVDANCCFDEIEAFRRGRAYQDLGVYWFEEPMQPHMKESHARLATALDMPIAIGENYYTRHQFYEVAKMQAVDIVQPDARRAGGVTEWMDIGSIAEAAGLKLASHGGGAGNVNILCAIPCAIYIESGSLKSENHTYKTQLKMIDGEILMPNAPGMGTEVCDDYIQEHAEK